MTGRYKNFDPKQCKAEVGDGTGWHWNQCSRKPKRDGWCEQHHPDSVAERERQKTARYEEEYRRSPRVQLDRAREEIARLKARIAELEEQLMEISTRDVDDGWRRLDGN